MSLNISKGNMYDFITHTWNTIKGKCYHDCSYCYMKRWGELKPVRFDEKELNTDLGENNFIFVGSSCDMFAEDIPVDWIYTTLNYMQGFNNKYLLQSKNPKRFKDFMNYYDSTIKLCTTIETNRFYKDIMFNAPIPQNRKSSLLDYITIEPIMNFDLFELINIIDYCLPEQVNIGADSGNNNLPEPSKEKILELITELEKFTKVKLKKNLNRLLR